MTSHEAIRKLPDGRVAVWSVPRLWELAKDLPVKRMDLTLHPALFSHAWGKNLSVAEIIEHSKRIWEADPTSYPVILAADGHVFDGLHRIAKRCLLGLAHLTLVQQFDTDPEPDYYE